jgi:hypothetical protein
VDLGLKRNHVMTSLISHQASIEMHYQANNRFVRHSKDGDDVIHHLFARPGL